MGDAAESFRWEVGQHGYLLSPYGMVPAGSRVRVEGRRGDDWLVTSPPGGSPPFPVAGQDLGVNRPDHLDPYPRGIPR